MNVVADCHKGHLGVGVCTRTHGIIMYIYHYNIYFYHLNYKCPVVAATPAAAAGRSCHQREAWVWPLYRGGRTRCMRHSPSCTPVPRPGGAETWHRPDKIPSWARSGPWASGLKTTSSFFLFCGDLHSLVHLNKRSRKPFKFSKIIYVHWCRIFTI